MDKITEVLTRGVANIIPGREILEKQLRSDKKLNIYLGIDPTAPRIHLGHAVSIRKLKAFVELGHNVTFLIGNFTTKIGDTSDKESERPILTDEEIEANFQTYKEQAEKILDFSKVKVVYNGDWLGKLTFSDIVRLTQNFSLNDFISRELIRKRLDEGKHVRLDETLYPIMQGFDSYHMDTDLQIGGTDQTFNMQAGRTLQKNLRNKESFVLTTVFLTGTDGRKMSKSWGNAIWLNDTPEDMYAKVMSIKDDLIVEYFTLGTNISLDEIESIKNQLVAGEHPMTVKKQLATHIVTELHSAEAAQKAHEYFEKTVQQHELPKEIRKTPVFSENATVLDYVMGTGIYMSKSEARRVIEQGGVTIDNKILTNPNIQPKAENGKILKVGKRNFFEIQVETI